MTAAEAMSESVGKIFRNKMISEVRQGVENNSNVFLISYSNFTGNQISDFRKDLRRLGASVYVTRNTIVKRALKDLERDQLSEKVDGQTALVWSNADSVEVSKILMKFVKEFEGVRVQGGLLEDRILEQSDVKRLADLPSKDVLRAQLLGTIAAPISRLLGAMNAKSRELLSILKQYSEQKGGN